VLDPPSEQVARELANELMSPYCPGRTISSCPSEQARKLEDWMLEQADAGRGKAEIETALVERFGREKLGSRTDPVVVWGSIGAAVVGGLALVAAARRWRRGAAPPPSPAGAVPPAAAPAELAGLERELEDLREF
jgi:cytochrome c-type biogenesis protein CcmH/NrfF